MIRGRAWYFYVMVGMSPERVQVSQALRRVLDNHFLLVSSVLPVVGENDNAA